MNQLEKIEKEVEEKWPLEKYRATCEQIKDLEMQFDYLNSKEGRAIANEISGSDAVERQVGKVALALKERRVEQAFLRKQLLK